MPHHGFNINTLLVALSFTTAVKAVGQCQGYDDGATFEDGGFTYEVHCNTDVQVGNAADTADGSFAACAAACNDYSQAHQDEPCVAGVVNSASQGGSACFIKTTNPGGVLSTAYDSIYRITPFVKGATCQDTANGATVTDSGVDYQVNCNTDIKVGDLDYFDNINSFADCAAACDDYSANHKGIPCQAGVVDSAAQGGSGCHLKGSTTGTADDGWDSIIRTTAFPPNTCLGKDDGSPFVEGGNTYQTRCYTDIKVDDIDNTILADPTFENCADLCNSNVACTGFVLTTDNGCHLKGSNDNIAASDSFQAAVLINRVQSSSSSSTSATFISGTTGVSGSSTVSGTSYTSSSFSGITGGTSVPTSSASSSETSSVTATSSETSVSSEVSTSSEPETSATSATTESTESVSFSTSATSESSLSDTASSSFSIPTSFTISTTGTISIPTNISQTSISSAIDTLSISSITNSLPSGTGASTQGEPSSVSGTFSVTPISATTASTSSVKYSNSTSVTGSEVSIDTTATSATISESSITTTGSGSVTAGSSETGSVSAIASSSGFFNGSSVSTEPTATSITGSINPTLRPASPFFSLQITLRTGIKGVLAPDGSISLDFSLAAKFQIVEDNLFQLGQALRRRDFGGIIATNPGADRQLFTPEVPPGSIKTTFIFSQFENGLAWENEAFFSGRAAFCVIGNNLFASFTQDTSFCDYTVELTLIPVQSGGSSTGIAAPTGTSGTSPSTVINNYNITTIFNNVNYEFNIDVNINIFNNSNFYCDNPDTFLAKLCETCEPVKVFKSNLTFAQCPCKTCAAEIMKLDSLADAPEGQVGSGTCKYGQVSCLSCKEGSSPAPPAAAGLAVVPAPCPVCPGSTTHIACPSSASAYVQSVASASGPAAACSAASKAIADSGVTITITKYAAPSAAAAAAGNSSVAPSTVVNLPCPSCPAGSFAVTLPQVAAKATGGSAAAVKATGAPSPQSPGTAAPIEGFKGDAMSLVKPIVSILCIALTFTATLSYVL